MTCSANRRIEPLVQAEGRSQSFWVSKQGRRE